MGCCASTPTAPEVLLADPGPTEPQTFTLKSAGMLSSDFVAFKGEAVDPQLKWFFVNKTGSFWGGGACTVDMENFVRGGNPDKPKQGQVLWSATFDESPTFDQRLKRVGLRQDAAEDFNHYAPPFAALLEVHPDPPDSAYLARAFPRDWSARDKALSKWMLRTSARILPGTRGGQFGDKGFCLEVFARGTSVCDYDRHRDDDGNVSYSKDVKEYVDHLCFNVVQLSTGQPVATWSVPGDFDDDHHLGVGGHNQGADVFQQNPLFQMTMAGGWAASTRLVKTAPNWDSVFALLVAYLCAVEYSPKEITSDLKSHFPDNPCSLFPGWAF